MAISRAVAPRSWPILLLPMLGLVELAGHFVTASRAPALAEWKHLASALPVGHEQGALIVVAPAWAEPLARWALGEERMPIRDLARPDDSTYADAIEISLLGSRDQSVAKWELIGSWPSPPFTLHHWHNRNAVQPRFDFVDGLHPPNVSVAQRIRGSNEACPWTESAERSAGGLGGPPALPAQRFVCSSHYLVSAGVTIIDDEGYDPRRCAWAHPPPNGQLELSYRDVPLGARLRGHMGIPWLPARDGLGTPVKLELSIDGRLVATKRYDEREGWRAFEIDTRAWAGGTHDVEWRILSKRFEFRHFCFEARAL